MPNYTIHRSLQSRRFGTLATNLQSRWKDQNDEREWVCWPCGVCIEEPPIVLSGCLEGQRQHQEPWKARGVEATQTHPHPYPHPLLA